MPHPFRVFIETDEGEVRLSPVELNVIGCPDLQRQIAGARLKNVSGCLLEFNPKAMALDLVINGSRGRLFRLGLRPLTWDMITHDFLNVLFTANGRLRSWSNGRQHVRFWA